MSIDGIPSSRHPAKCFGPCAYRLGKKQRSAIAADQFISLVVHRGPPPTIRILLAALTIDLPTMRSSPYSSLAP
jgi:hypothetical protein